MNPNSLSVHIYIVNLNHGLWISDSMFWYYLKKWNNNCIDIVQDEIFQHLTYRSYVLAVQLALPITIKNLLC